MKYMKKYLFELHDNHACCVGTFDIECEIFPTSAFIVNYILDNKDKFFTQFVLNDKRMLFSKVNEGYIKDSAFIRINCCESNGVSSNYFVANIRQA